MSAIQYSEVFWDRPGTTRKLFYRRWDPEHPPKRSLVLVHGFSEHSGRYAILATALAERGLSVICPDLWGHGRSQGLRGDSTRIEDYVDDLDMLTTALFAGQMQSFALFGHSFGGLVAVHWALRAPHRLTCLMLQSPLLKLGYSVPQWKKTAAKLIGAWWPTVPIPLGFDVTYLNHDPVNIHAYAHDPLVHNRITWRNYEALQAAMTQAVERADRLTVPTLLLYGDEDRIVDIATCQRFFEQLTCEKRLVNFPGCYHELHHEAVLLQIVEEIAGWALHA